MVIGYSYRASDAWIDDVQAERDQLKTINRELLVALRDTVNVARKAITQNGTDPKYADIRLKNALAAIARAEGKQ